VKIILIATGCQSRVHPQLRFIIHEFRLTPPILTCVIAFPIRVIQVAIQGSGGIQTHRRIPSIMLCTALTQVDKQKVHCICPHVLRLVPIINTPLVRPLPVGIKERSGTNAREVSHAAIEDPAKVRLAAGSKGSAQVGAWICRHVCWFTPIVPASLS